MIEKGLGLIVVIVFLSMILLLSIVVAIVKRNERIIRNIAFSVVLISLLSILFTGGYLLVKSVLKAKDVVVETGEKLLGNEYYTSSTIDSLKLLEPAGVQVPVSYYTYFGMRDYYRFPIVYPYSIVAIDVLDNATLYNESGVQNIAISANKSEAILNNISEFLFDEHYFIAILSDSIKSFVLIEFSTKKCERFETKENLMERAKSLGFVAKQKEISVREYSQKF